MYEGVPPGAREGSVTRPWVAEHELLPLQPCWLDGHEFRCPAQPYPVLTRLYGWDLSPVGPPPDIPALADGDDVRVFDVPS